MVARALRGRLVVAGPSGVQTSPGFSLALQPGPWSSRFAPGPIGPGRSFVAPAPGVSTTILSAALRMMRPCSVGTSEQCLPAGKNAVRMEVAGRSCLASAGPATYRRG
jgi:hypothetical protein